MNSCSCSIPHCKWIEGGMWSMVYIQQSLQLLQLFPMRLERFVFLILLLNDFIRLGLSLLILLSFDHMYGPRYLIECLPKLIYIVSNLGISKSLFLRLYALSYFTQLHCQKCSHREEARWSTSTFFSTWPCCSNNKTVSYCTF